MESQHSTDASREQGLADARAWVASRLRWERMLSRPVLAAPPAPAAVPAAAPLRLVAVDGDEVTIAA